MARYGMDYDRGYRGARGYGSDYREGGDWNRDEFTSGSRHYNTVHNDWHINRDAGTGDRGWTGGNRQAGGYGHQGGTGFGRADHDLDQGGYGEAGWTGWSGARSSRDLGGEDRWERYGTTSRGFGGFGNRGYDVEDYSTFRAGGGHTGGGYTGGGYTGGGYSGGYSGGGHAGGGYMGGGYTGGGSMAGGYTGGGSMGGGYTGGMNRNTMGGYGASNWGRERGEFNDRGYDQDFGDRVREGWDNLRDRARGFFRR